MRMCVGIRAAPSVVGADEISGEGGINKGPTGCRVSRGPNRGSAVRLPPRGAAARAASLPSADRHGHTAPFAAGPPARPRAHPGRDGGFMVGFVAGWPGGGGSALPRHGMASERLPGDVAVESGHRASFALPIQRGFSVRTWVCSALRARAWGRRA